MILTVDKYLRQGGVPTRVQVWVCQSTTKRCLTLRNRLFYFEVLHISLEVRARHTVLILTSVNLETLVQPIGINGPIGESGTLNGTFRCKVLGYWSPICTEGNVSNAGSRVKFNILKCVYALVRLGALKLCGSFGGGFNG